jgi:hypothetical protein
MNILELPELAKKFEFDNKAWEEKSNEYVSLNERAKELLPFEQAQIDTLVREKRVELSSFSKPSEYDSKYKRIDMNYVKKLRIWDKKNKMYVPRFAIYNMGVNVMRMTFKFELDRRSNISKYGCDGAYNDLTPYTFLDFVQSYCFDIEDKTILTHTFEGFLPDETRKIIKDVNNDPIGFKLSEMYLIEESYNWEKNSEKKKFVRNLDPVVVGYKHGVYYYVTHFDVTPSEKFIVSEMVG